MRIARYGTVTVLMAGSFLGAGTANAQSGLNITEVQHHTRQPIEIASCRNDGGTCTIEKGHEVSASVNSDVGVDFGAVNASLGGGYQETYTDTVGCSRDLSAGQRLVMYPSGDFVFFEQDGNKGTAFLPTGVECMLESDW